MLFLAAAFVAIGVFASSLTENQIVAFILAVFLSFMCYLGFEWIGELLPVGGFDLFMINLGINEHYISMSRGVVDTRDMIYFLSLIAIFLLLTRTVLQSRKW